MKSRSMGSNFEQVKTEKSGLFRVRSDKSHDGIQNRIPFLKLRRFE